MKTKLMLLFTIGAMAMVASAQNIHTAFPRSSARQSSALSTMHSAGSTLRISPNAVGRFAGAGSTSRISANAVGRFAGAGATSRIAANAVGRSVAASAVAVGPTALTPPNAVNKSGASSESLRLITPPTAIKGNPVSTQ